MSAYASEHTRGSLTKSDAWLYVDELTHRTLNDYAIMLATVRRASSGSGDARSSTALAAVARRLEAGVTAFSALRPSQSSPYRNLDEDLEKLCASLSTSRLADRQIALTLSAEPVMLSSHRSWQVSLIIAELITNAAKHAFDQLTCGAIVVDVKADRNVLICIVRDNGSASLNTKPGRGSRIIDALANDLGGSIARNFSSRGATICLRVPLI
jgi:two-component sensor histidine kinase